METISKYFNVLAQSALGKNGFAQADLLARWDTIVGPEIAAICVPRQFKRLRPDAPGTLVLKAHAGRGLELQYQIPQVISRVNQYFGYQAIAAVKIVQGSAASQTPQRPPAPDARLIAARLSGFEDDDLKEALAQLGAAVAACSPQTK
jgi:hypothetical protein